MKSMKRTFVSLMLIIIMISTVLTSCDIDKIFGVIDEETEKTQAGWWC